MKKYNLLLLLMSLLFVCNPCVAKGGNGQGIADNKNGKGSVATIQYDFAASDISKPKPAIKYFDKDGNPIDVKHKQGLFVITGQDVRFVMINVNRQLYTVTMNGSVLAYQTQPPPALQQFAGLNQNLAAATSSAEKALEDLRNPAGEYIKAYNVLKAKVALLEKSKTLYMQLQSVGQDPSLKMAEAKIKCEGLVEDFTGTKGNYDIVGEVAKRLSEVMSASDDETKQYASVTKANISVTNSKMNQSAQSIVDKITDGSELNKKNVKEFIAQQISQGVTDPIIDQINVLHASAQQVMSQINAYDYVDLSEKLTSIYSATISTSNYEAHTETLNVEGDEVNFTYKVDPIATTKWGQAIQPLAGSVAPLWIKRGWRVQFATGIGFSTIGLLNNSFRVDTTAGQDSVAIRRNKKNDWLIPNAVVYAHFITRVSRYGSVGLSVGVAANFQDISHSNFNLGFTAIAGSKFSVDFTVGCAMGLVNVLKGQYDINTGPEDHKNLYKSGNIDANNLTANALRFGLFVGVSLNLANIPLPAPKKQ
ncbi:MAG: hypothetical protein JWO06_2340 [Bacteroidota bacterium]|nr:hypothetical protein [Bacteroidota bacterium]